MQIRCIGQLTIDDIVLPDGTVRMETMGGNAMYSASGAMLWMKKGEVAPISCAGRDYPVHFMNFLKAKGMDCSGIRRGSYQHMRSWVLYEANRERRCLCRNEEVLPYPPISEEAFHQYFEIYRKLHLQGSPLISDFPESFSADAYHLAPQSYERHIANVTLIRQHAPEAVVSLDPSPFYMHGNDAGQLCGVLRHVDIVMPSREECFSYFGRLSAEETARRLCAMGPQISVVKLGAEGAYVYMRKKNAGVLIPSVAREVVDTTGAGDAFCGGFLAGYCSTKNAVYAACCGAVSASYAVADYGPGKLLTADPEEALERQQELFEHIKSENRRELWTD